MPDFGDAIRGLRAGELWARYDWSMNTWVDLTSGDDPSDPYGVCASYLRLCRPGRLPVPWTPTHEDLLADDWVRVDV